MVMNCHKIWSDIKLVPSCISFHTYFIKFHIPLSLYSFCGSKTADTNELVFTSELTFPVRLDGLIKVILVQQRKQAKIGFETFRSKYIKLCVSSDVGKKEIRSERKRTCFLRRSNMRFSIRALSINKLELRK